MRLLTQLVDRLPFVQSTCLSLISYSGFPGLLTSCLELHLLHGCLPIWPWKFTPTTVICQDEKKGKRSHRFRPSLWVTLCSIHLFFHHRSWVGYSNANTALRFCYGDWLCWSSYFLSSSQAPKAGEFTVNCSFYTTSRFKLAAIQVDSQVWSHMFIKCSMLGWLQKGFFIILNRGPFLCPVGSLTN